MFSLCKAGTSFVSGSKTVEAVISAIKRKLGEPLLSKDPIARVNELLAKLLAYNIGVVIHEAYEHHIEVGVRMPDLDRPYAG